MAPPILVPKMQQQQQQERWRLIEYRYQDYDGHHKEHRFGLFPNGKLTRWLMKTGNINILVNDKYDGLDEGLKEADSFESIRDVYSRLYSCSSEKADADLRDVEDLGSMFDMIGLYGNRRKILDVILHMHHLMSSTIGVLLSRPEGECSFDQDNNGNHDMISLGSTFDTCFEEVLSRDLLLPICQLAEQEASDIIEETMSFPVVDGPDNDIYRSTYTDCFGPREREDTVRVDLQRFRKDSSLTVADVLTRLFSGEPVF